MSPRGASSSDQRILPEGFLWGVATAAFQVEGGINGPGEPENNWVWWERAGQVEPSGNAVNFWERYEEHLDRAKDLGCNIFRLGVEWARIEPEPGKFDAAALDHYDKILVACHERAMVPMVTIHHFTHPAYLGDDFWLSAESSNLFERYAIAVIDRLGVRCKHWITINEINIVTFASYVLGIYPPGRRVALGDFNAATANLVAAHVKAYDAIHARVPDAQVTTNNSSTSTYEYDRLFIDLLLARASGVARSDVSEWVMSKRREWYSLIAPPNRVEQFIRRYSMAAAPIARVPIGPSPRLVGEPMAPALDAIYGSENELSLDVLGIDYYDPVASNHVQTPGKLTAGGRSMAPAGEIWDEKIYPEGLITYIKANVELSKEAKTKNGKPLDLWVVENGMCNRMRRGRSFDRTDLWDRPRYLKENIAAMVGAVDSGLPVTAYLHWSLVDNYEWGSYEPRFGIYGVDRERNTKILDTDSMGRDSAGAYRKLIKGLNEGDRSVISS
jgi:beta-glucosidase